MDRFAVEAVYAFAVDNLARTDAQRVGGGCGQWRRLDAGALELVLSSDEV